MTVKSFDSDTPLMHSIPCAFRILSLSAASGALSCGVRRCIISRANSLNFKANGAEHAKDTNEIRRNCA